MSPDPPREESGDEDSRLRQQVNNGQLVEGIIMDDSDFFLVPDAPYELDMEEESDYTDSDEDEGGGQNDMNAIVQSRLVAVESRREEGDEDGQEGEVVEGQGRGRYRLLIPFPNPTTDEGGESNEESRRGHEDRVGGGEVRSRGASQDPPETERGGVGECSKEECGSGQDSGDGSEKPGTSSGGNVVQKREIELSEEKVETIMQVMKNITLPPAAIPKWASEVDEDVWRKKLEDSIGNKSSRSRHDIRCQQEKKVEQ